VGDLSQTPFPFVRHWWFSTGPKSPPMDDEGVLRGGELIFAVGGGELFSGDRWEGGSEQG